MAMNAIRSAALFLLCCACASGCTMDCFLDYRACAKEREDPDACQDAMLQCVEDCRGHQDQAEESKHPLLGGLGLLPKRGSWSKRTIEGANVSLQVVHFLAWLRHKATHSSQDRESFSPYQPIKSIGSWSKREPISVEGRGSWDKRKPISVEERGSWDKREPISVEGRGSWDKREPINVEGRGSWSKRDQPISVEDRGSWSKREPISVAVRGSWSKREPIVVAERGSWSKRQPISEQKRGSWSKRSLSPSEPNVFLKRGSWN